MIRRYIMLVLILFLSFNVIYAATSCEENNQQCWQDQFSKESPKTVDTYNKLNPKTLENFNQLSAKDQTIDAFNLLGGTEKDKFFTNFNWVSPPQDSLSFIKSYFKTEGFSEQALQGFPKQIVTKDGKITRIIGNNIEVPKTPSGELYTNFIVDKSGNVRFMSISNRYKDLGGGFSIDPFVNKEPEDIGYLDLTGKSTAKVENINGIDTLIIGGTNIDLLTTGKYGTEFLIAPGTTGKYKGFGIDTKDAKKNTPFLFTNFGISDVMSGSILKTYPELASGYIYYDSKNNFMGGSNLQGVKLTQEDHSIVFNGKDSAGVLGVNSDKKAFVELGANMRYLYKSKEIFSTDNANFFTNAKNALKSEGVTAAIGFWKREQVERAGKKLDSVTRSEVNLYGRNGIKVTPEVMEQMTKQGVTAINKYISENPQLRNELFVSLEELRSVGAGILEKQDPVLAKELNAIVEEALAGNLDSSDKVIETIQKLKTYYNDANLDKLSQTEKDKLLKPIGNILGTVSNNGELINVGLNSVFQQNGIYDIEPGQTIEVLKGMGLDVEEIIDNKKTVENLKKTRMFVNYYDGKLYFNLDTSEKFSIPLDYGLYGIVSENTAGYMTMETSNRALIRFRTGDFKAEGKGLGKITEGVGRLGGSFLSLFGNKGVSEAFDSSEIVLTTHKNYCGDISSDRCQIATELVEKYLASLTEKPPEPIQQRD